MTEELVLNGADLLLKDQEGRSVADLMAQCVSMGLDVPRGSYAWEQSQAMRRATEERDALALGTGPAMGRRVTATRL